MYHRRKEEDSKSSLEIRSMIEGINRQQLPLQLKEARSKGLLSNGFTDGFIKEVEGTPLDWGITASRNGLRFEREFPYDTHFYGMKGWDRAVMAVNLDPDAQSIAFRTYLHDDVGEVTIKEGALVTGGEVTAFNQELSGGGIYSWLLREISREITATNGESGCLFDHMKDQLDELPRLVEELSGGKIGHFAREFFQRVTEGKIDITTLPTLSLGYPLPPDYLEEPEVLPLNLKRIEANKLLSVDEKRRKIEQIASKDKVSAQKLKELVYLIWDTFSRRLTGDLVLPSKQNVEVSFSLWPPEENQGWITIYNGPNQKTGETIDLSDEEGEPLWRIGIWKKYHSTLLDRDKETEVPHRDLMASKEPLSPEECSIVAKALTNFYKKASFDPSESLIVSYKELDALINR